MSVEARQPRMIPRRSDMIVGKWGARFFGRRFPCAIGKAGFSSDKREGDHATPIACLRIMRGGYRKERSKKPKCPFQLAAIGPNDIWSDDARDPRYNHKARKPSAYSHEKLRRSDPLYDVFLITDWNWPDATAGKGSAIFIHNWRKPRHPTEGCIAFDPKDLKWIMARWQKESRILIKAS